MFNFHAIFATGFVSLPVLCHYLFFTFDIRSLYVLLGTDIGYLSGSNEMSSSGFAAN